MRIPGASKQDGESLAGQLKQRLADLPLGIESQRLGFMRLRIQGLASADPATLSNSIAAALTRKLTRNQANPHA